MSNVKRVYVEKKPEFAVAAKGLRHEIRHYLGLQDVTNVRVLIRYDAEIRERIPQSSVSVLSKKMRLL